MFVDPMRSQAFEQLRRHDLRPVARLRTLDILREAAAPATARLPYRYDRKYPRTKKTHARAQQKTKKG